MAANDIPKILIVDDYVADLDAIEAMLAGPGIEIVRVESGEAALSSLLREDFALILLDMKMPGMDWVETASVIRQNAGARITPIIFVTGLEQDPRQTLSAYQIGGVIDFLSKPVVPEILKAKVSVFIELYRKNIELRLIAEQQRAEIAMRREAEEKLHIHQIELETQNEELKNTRAEVEALLGQYTDLYDFAPAGYFTLDRDGTIRRANLTGAQMLGKERARLTKSRFGQFVSPAGRPAFNEFLQKVFTNRAAPSDRAACEVTLAKERARPSSAKPSDSRPAHEADLRHVHIEAQASEDGQECRTIVLDITEHKRMEKALIETNRGLTALYKELDEKDQRLKLAYDRKSVFLANMGHELRTPLNSIAALTRLLLERADGDLTAEQEKQMGFIRKAAGDLSALIDNLLDMAKLEVGKIIVTPNKFEVATLFGTLRGMFQPLRKGSEVSLIFEEPRGLPPLDTDEGKVAQILRNLISNALKYTEEGEVRESRSVLEKNLKGTIVLISETIEMRGPYTPGHHERVKKLAAAIAAERGLTDFQTDGLELAAAVYDIGLIKIPAEFLQDTERLDGSKAALYHTYPLIGHDLLMKIDFPWPIAEIILQHRECMDGSGFPRGLKGDAILIEARILAVADVVEDLTSNKIYRPPMAIDKALEVIAKGSGVRYDPEIATACLRLFGEKRYEPAK